jgi:hypothetical protein
MQQVTGAVYNQTLAVVNKKGSGGVGSTEETLNKHLVDGKAFIQIDNVRGKLDSQIVESFVTAKGMFPARIPYHGTIDINPAKHVLFISSNGFEATKDLANRSCIVRIKKREGHVFQDYGPGGDLLGFTFVAHKHFLGAVFAIVRHWFEQGKPKTSETRHDFREWCQSLDWIVQNIFGLAPLMDGHQEAKQRAANPQLTYLRLLAVQLDGANKLGIRLTASDLVEFCNEADIEIPRLTTDQAQDMDTARKQVGKIMAKLFDQGDELTVEGYTVTRGKKPGDNLYGNWQEINTYTFAKPLTPAVTHPVQATPGSVEGNAPSRPSRPS